MSARHQPQAAQYQSAAICAEIIKKLQKLDYPDGFMVAVASCKCNKMVRFARHYRRDHIEDSLS
jgi:hypothetical protein